MAALWLDPFLIFLLVGTLFIIAEIALQGALGWLFITGLAGWLTSMILWLSGMSTWLEGLAVFVFVLLGVWGLSFKVLRRWQYKKRVGPSVSGFMGEYAEVTHTIHTQHPGKVYFSGTYWTAILSPSYYVDNPEVPSDFAIPIGSSVEIVDMQGIHLIVVPVAGGEGLTQSDVSGAP